MPDSERARFELAYAPGLYENPAPNASPAEFGNKRDLRMEIAEERRSNPTEYLKKAVQFFYRARTWFRLAQSPLAVSVHAFSTIL